MPSSHRTLVGQPRQSLRSLSRPSACRDHRKLPRNHRWPRSATPSSLKQKDQRSDRESHRRSSMVPMDQRRLYAFSDQHRWRNPYRRAFRCRHWNHPAAAHGVGSAATQACKIRECLLTTSMGLAPQLTDRPPCLHGQNGHQRSIPPVTSLPRDIVAEFVFLLQMRTCRSIAFRQMAAAHPRRMPAARAHPQPQSPAASHGCAGQPSIHPSFLPPKNRIRLPSLSKPILHPLAIARKHPPRGQHRLCGRRKPLGTRLIQTLRKTKSFQPDSVQRKFGRLDRGHIRHHRKTHESATCRMGNKERIPTRGEKRNHIPRRSRT